MTRPDLIFAAVLAFGVSLLGFATWLRRADRRRCLFANETGDES